MKKLSIVLLLLYLGFSYAENNNDKIAVLTSVVQGLIKHPKILALLCWDKGISSVHLKIIYAYKALK